MPHTRTGHFPIGFRRGWTEWQKNLGSLVQWARTNSFECLDVGPLPPEELKQITAAGMKIGTVDVRQPWDQLASPDGGKRKAAAAAAAEQMKSAIAAGAKVFFVVVFPEKNDARRIDNHGYAVDGYGQLCQALAGTGAKIAIEGYPGGPPHYSALACTPESYRALFKDVGSDVMAINFDPSHLIRMGIDPVRFLGEFAPRVAHVHGKDTELLDEGLYEFGNLQEATFAKGRPYGAFAWRYTIPGHGTARWGKLLSILKDSGYKGFVSIELEDEHFNGSTEGEQRGLLVSRDYLTNV